MEANDNKFSNVIFITGGTKSGKSEFAEYLGKKIQNITYIALSESRPNDINWQRKIIMHRKRRPKDWQLLETTNLISALENEPGPVLILSLIHISEPTRPY